MYKNICTLISSELDENCHIKVWWKISHAVRKINVSFSPFQIAAFMSGNLDFFSQPAGYRTRGSSVCSSAALEGPRSHPAVNTFRQRTAYFISSISKVSPVCVFVCTSSYIALFYVYQYTYTVMYCLTSWPEKMDYLDTSYFRCTALCLCILSLSFLPGHIHIFNALNADAPHAMYLLPIYFSP